MSTRRWISYFDPNDHLVGLAFVFVAVLAPVASAQDRRLWGGLEPGSHAVGFASAWQLDHARRYAPAYDAARADAGPGAESPRPILVYLWYPARRTEAAPMRYRTYLEIGSDDPRIGPFARRLAAFTRQTIAEEVLEERPAKIDAAEKAGIERWLDAPTYAVKDAPVAPGKFPLVVGHPGLGGTIEDNSALYEYLASHGFVVAVAAYQSENSAYLNIDWDLDRSIKEMDFLVRYAKAKPGFDLGPIGAIGHSYGAQAVLAWRGENNSAVEAVVSLDSTVEHTAPDNPVLAPLKAHLASADRLAGPILIFAPKEELESYHHWDHWKYTRLYTVTVTGLEHNDFITQGAARFAFLPGRNTTAEKGAAVRTGYDGVCRLVLRFFDACLKGDRKSVAFLKDCAGGKGIDPKRFAVTVREPAPLPPSGAQLLELSLRRGIDEATRMARRFGPEMPEESLGDAGSGLIDAAKPAEGLSLMRLRCELHPTSWGAQLHLAERLLEDGDRAAALAAYREAQRLIASGSKPAPSERVRKMIENGLKKAGGG